MLPSHPTVSVVIPFYERASTVAAAAASALAQEGVALELVAVDDGSADDGAARLAALGDKRLRVLNHPANRGAAAARNTGVAASAAPLIAFLDSDDLFLPGKLAAQVALMEREGLDLCFGGFTVESGGGIRTVLLDVPPEDGWARGFLDGCFVSPGSTLLARREVFERLGGLDPSLARFEDWDFLLRAALAGLRFGAVPGPVARIVPARHPGPERLEPALAALAARHGEAITRVWGGAARRRFCASLAIERAVARWRAGQRLGGIAALAGAAIAPGRLVAFARRHMRRAVANRERSA